MADEPKAAPVPQSTSAPADFAQIESFLKTHCIDCHGEKTQKGDVALHTFHDAGSVVKARDTWETVLEKVRNGEMPPKKKPRPEMKDVQAFTHAVDAIFAHHDTNAKPDPGHVTVRRLNKTEYDNTIRDLVGVDFQPAADFPSDDVGHGFDNIGDVLSLSPVLMERYLSAADGVMGRAILPDPPKPPTKWTGGPYLEPALKDPGKVKLRPLADKGGSLFTNQTLNMEGEYVFRMRAGAEGPDDEPVRASMTVDGKEVRSVEVKPAKDHDKEKNKDRVRTEQFEAKLNLAAGGHKFAVTLLNPSESKDGKDGKDGEAKRTLLVEYINIEGPADTRPPSQRKLLECDSSLPKAAQTRQVLKRFASKAYRRPATDDEVDRLCKLVDQSEAAGEKWEAGVQFAMQAVLVSPKFLFRMELDDRPDAAEPHPIDEYQLASRLSYFLWSSMPDDELFDLASKKQLTANLDQQVRRMLKDPKAKSLVDNFAMQWLQLRRLKTFMLDTQKFPGFDDRLRFSMGKETELFVEAIFKEDRSVLDLIDADFTFLNERLARHYGIADTNGNWMYQKPNGPKGDPIPRETFVRVKLPANGPRGGVLTQASLLAVTSNPTRTSPVKRGKFVLDQILGTPPPPPPANVPELKETGPLTGTLRQRMEQHRADPSCASCHALMDPIGFAFENFDAIGAFRDKDGGAAIDPSGMLPDGKKFQGPGELRAILKDKKQLFAKCLTQKLMTYALGRGVEYYDSRTVNGIVADLDKDGYRFSTLVTGIVKSDAFRMRRGKGLE